MPDIKLLLVATVTVFSALQIAYSDTKTLRTVESETYEDVLQLFDEIGYTAEQWQAGIREVPRIELTDIPQRWQKTAQTIPIGDKKNIFFRLVGSGILQANEEIAAERAQLLDAIASGNTADTASLTDLALKYRVIRQNTDPLDDSALEMLKRRIDIVPPSLALAQAAEESGWGTSRFAVKKIPKQPQARRHHNEVSGRDPDITDVCSMPVHAI